MICNQNNHNYYYYSVTEIDFGRCSDDVHLSARSGTALLRFCHYRPSLRHTIRQKQSAAGFMGHCTPLCVSPREFRKIQGYEINNSPPVFRSHQTSGPFLHTPIRVHDTYLGNRPFNYSGNADEGRCLTNRIQTRSVSTITELQEGTSQRFLVSRPWKDGK
jgi:hypothetical protein